MRKTLLLALFLFCTLRAYSQIVGADTRQIKVKAEKTYTSGQAVLFNYECFPSAASTDALIGLTYYNVEKWGYYGNLMVSVGGLSGKAEYAIDRYNSNRFYMSEQKYKTAGFVIRGGGIIKVTDSVMPYCGLGFRSWKRNWILGNGKLATEEGKYQKDFNLEAGCILQFGSVACSLGLVGYINDTFKEMVYPNIKIGIGYAF